MGREEFRAQERKKIEFLLFICSFLLFVFNLAVTACYNLAKQAGKKYFAVQFYGECWVSDDDLKYKKYSQATNCYQGVGANWSNYVYKIRA